MPEIYLLLKQRAQDLGADLFGVADITQLSPNDILIAPHTMSGMQRAVVIGVKLLDGVLNDIIDSPTQLYFHHYRQINFQLDRIALEVGKLIEKQGARAITIAASQLIDWQKQQGHISHRALGQKAGLGWRGRNNLLINPIFGARIRLVSVLTDLELPADSPLKQDCGDCRACIKACPAESIKENLEDFDTLSCMAKLKEFQKQGLVSQMICGVCVKACRGGKKS